MIKLTGKILVAAFLSSALCPAVFAAGGTAQTLPVKMGYFNLNQIKATFPEAVAVVSMEERAKDQIKRALDKANTELTEMQKQGKSKEEIEKRKNDLQIGIGAEQQALSSLLSSNSQEANRAIAQAAVAVAKEKGLDIVIDASGIYAGGDKFASNGEDVTESVLRRLVPSAVKPAEATH